MNSKYLLALRNSPTVSAVLWAYGLDELRSYLDTTTKKQWAPCAEETRLLKTLFPPSEIARLRQMENHRKNAKKAYQQLAIPAAYKWSSRIDGCHQNALILQHLQRESCLTVPYACGLPLCPACARERSIIRFARIHSYLSSRLQSLLRVYPNHVLRMATFTIRNVTGPFLASAIPAVLKAFRQFRRKCDHWSSQVQGYIFNFEVTVNPNDHTYHPHLHVLIFSKYITRRLFAATWSRCCKARDLYADPVNSVDVRNVYAKAIDSLSGDPPSITQAVLEIAKYIVAPLKGRSPDLSSIATITYALRGPRIQHPHRYRLHGSAGVLALPSQPKTSARYALIASISALLRDRESVFWSDRQAQREILDCLRQDRTLYAILLSRHHDLAIIERADHP